MKKVPLTNSPAYVKFIHDRDKALESILAKYQRLASLYLENYRQNVKKSAAIYWQLGGLKSSGFDHSLQVMAKLQVYKTNLLYRKLKLSAYVLASTGEAEAISRALESPAKYKLSQEKLQHAQRDESHLGGSLKERIQLYYSRLIRKIQNAVEMSLVYQEDLSQTLSRIDLAFPKKKPTSNRRHLKKLKEARTTIKDKITELSVGDVDDQAWKEAVDDYKSEYLEDEAQFRDDAYKAIKDGKEKYVWEVEQDLNDEFVQSVRDGQNETAKDNGIKDLMWIAIIDDKTDDCCKKRDGLSSTEIEAKLKSDWSDDDCDATVPPAHANCRCTMAPMVNELPDTPEMDFGDFHEWINS